jgi:hypothetical protein
MRGLFSLVATLASMRYHTPPHLPIAHPPAPCPARRLGIELLSSNLPDSPNLSNLFNEHNQRTEFRFQST